MKPPQKELIADGNRHKPPRAKSVPSTTSSETHTIIGDIDDEITTSASESYPQEESSSNEGNPQTSTYRLALLKNYASRDVPSNFIFIHFFFSSKWRQKLLKAKLFGSF